MEKSTKLGITTVRVRKNIENTAQSSTQNEEDWFVYL